MLLDRFQKIKNMEIKVKKKYDYYIGLIDDPEITKELADIRDDEIEHISIAEGLIDCISPQP